MFTKKFALQNGAAKSKSVMKNAVGGSVLPNACRHSNYEVDVKEKFFDKPAMQHVKTVD